MRIYDEGGQASLFAPDGSAGRMSPACSAAASPKGRTSGSSWNRSPELQAIPYLSLDLTPGAGIAGNSIPFTRPHPWGWQPAGKLRVGAAFSLAWGVFDAQYWSGTPQRRRRVFLVADFAGQSAPKILFDQESLPGHPAQGDGAGQASPVPAPCGPPGAGGADQSG